MPFWLHESHAMLVLKSVSAWKRWVISAVLLGIVTFLWIFVVYSPTKNKIESCQQELSQLTRQKKLFEVSVVHYESVVALHEKLKQAFGSLCSNVHSFQKTVSSLLQLLREQGISCRGIVQDHVVTKRFYTKHYVQLKGKTEFKNILFFLRNLGQIKYPIKFKSFVMWHGRGKQSLRFQALVRLISISEGGADAA